MNLKHIQAFVTVADLGSFRRAASHLNTTQPNISSRIAQLERQLGVSLMERDAGSVRLTLKGQNLIGPARSVLAAVDGFVTAAGDDALFNGALRLGVSEMVAHTWLRAFLVEMKERFPNIYVELTVDLSASLSRALFAHELDLLFQSGPFDRKTRMTLSLGQSPYVWVAAGSIALPDGPVTPSAIAEHPILSHARGTVPYQQLEDHFRAAGIPARLVPSSNIAACLQMTQDGLGIACLPQAMLTQLLATGRLRALDYAWRPDALRFAARCDLDPLPHYIQEAARIAQRLSPPEADDHVS
jgi:DNA-binding transcriptional LysR family regulator